MIIFCFRKYCTSDYRLLIDVKGFPGAQLVKNPPAMWETWFQSLAWEDPLEKGMATHSSTLAWRSPWTIPWSHKESDTNERLSLSLMLKLNLQPIKLKHLLKGCREKYFRYFLILSSHLLFSNKRKLMSRELGQPVLGHQ